MIMLFGALSIITQQWSRGVNVPFGIFKSDIKSIVSLHGTLLLYVLSLSLKAFSFDFIF